MARHYNFGEPITCHSWNDQNDQIALSLNDNFVHIYAYSGKSWDMIDTLEEHELRVTAMDWCPKTNQIVTCGEDRNAYVWTCYEEGWKPTLVLLRINRAAMCVKWSPKGDKFAVGSSAKLVAVCHFDDENDWWVSKHIKKSIKSTVTCLDWHPNNILLSAGSTDFKTRIFSALLPELDKSLVSSQWGNAEKFGTLLAEFTNECGGWVYSTSFSPSGNKLAWCSYDSTITIVDISSSGSMIVEKTPYLPFKSLKWIDENALVMAGYDCCPVVYVHTDDKKLVFKQKMDQVNSPKANDKSTLMSAMSKFQSMDKHATTAHVDTAVNTLHQNTINQIQIVTKARDAADVFSTVGLDGIMVMWEVPANVSGPSHSPSSNNLGNGV